MDRQRTVPRFTWVLIGALAILTVVATFLGVRSEESDLTSQSTTALETASLPFSVTFDGRDATVTGTAETHRDIDNAARAIAAIHGVRVVDVTSIGVTSEVVAPAWIQITRQEDGVRLDGRVADPQTAEQLVQAATSAFGLVDNQLTINAATEQPTWLPKLSPLLVELSDWRSGVLDARESGITINGIVDSASQAERIPTILSDATRLNLIYDLDVVANRVPQLTIVAADGQLTLRGEVPSESILDTIISATAAYTDVDNGLRVGPVADAAWFALVDDALIRLADWPAWTMSVVGGDGTFTGRAPSSRSLLTQQNDLIDRMGITWETVDLEVSQAALADELTATVSGTLNFETASAALDPESLDLLEDVATVLRANPSAVLIVEGHTDNEGRDDSNLALSQARAEAVVTYLGSLGIDETRLTAIGYGETRPIAENGTLIGRAQNRRIEFVVEEQDA